VSRGGFETGAADGVEAVRDMVRYDVKHGADVIKICATGGVLSPTDSVGVQQYTEEEIRAVVEAARMMDRRVAAHAHGLEGIKAAVRAGVTSIEHGSILDAEAVRMMKERGTWLVPTLLAGVTVESLATAGRLPPAIAAKALAIAPRMRASFKLAVDGSVRIALGTDAGVMRHGSNGREFGLMVRYGMTPMQAIVAGTSSGATLLGLEAEIGTIAAGKRADVVAVRGDPLQAIALLERVDFVMKDGVVFKRDGQVVGRSAAGAP
jgi:imidazolonepropionase-like amidohydrolase